jgi:hypothetical protein
VQNETHEAEPLITGNMMTVILLLTTDQYGLKAVVSLSMA